MEKEVKNVLDTQISLLIDSLKPDKTESFINDINKTIDFQNIKAQSVIKPISKIIIENEIILNKFKDESSDSNWFKSLFKKSPLINEKYNIYNKLEINNQSLQIKNAEITILMIDTETYIAHAEQYKYIQSELSKGLPSEIKDLEKIKSILNDWSDKIEDSLSEIDSYKEIFNSLKERNKNKIKENKEKQSNLEIPLEYLLLKAINHEPAYSEQELSLIGTVINNIKNIRPEPQEIKKPQKNS